MKIKEHIIKHKIKYLCISISIIISVAILLFFLNKLFSTPYDNISDIPIDDSVVYNEERKLEEFYDLSVIGILYIDKIELKAAVSDNIDLNTMKTYIGHFPDTAYTDGNIRPCSTQQR